MSTAFRRRRRTAALGATLAAAAVLVAGCADFSQVRAEWSAQPSLVPQEVQPVVPEPPRPGVTPTETSSQPSTPPDPCRPADPSIVAACVVDPWALIPVDERSAVVGERTTGRILLVTYQEETVELFSVPGIDSSGDGGLLGIALSPTFYEDNLLYAYITTAEDNRVVRLAAGDAPTPLLTGIPKGTEHNGGAIGFVGDLLYIATGDAGDPEAAADLDSLAGKVLRIDGYGNPHGGTLAPTSPVFSLGLQDPTGSCVLPTGEWAVLDQRTEAALLLAAAPGRDLASGAEAVWSWPAGQVGATDCAWDAGVLATTSLEDKKVTGMDLDAEGAFVGVPRDLLGDRYGRLRTIEAGPGQVFWVTTANAGTDTSTASDDLVVVIPNGGGGEGGLQ